MVARILTTFGLWIAIIICLVIFKGHAGAVLLATLSGLAQWELYLMLRKMGYHPSSKLGCGLGCLMVLLAYYLPFTRAPSAAYAYAGFSLVLAVGIAAAYCTISKQLRDQPAKALMSTLFGIVFVPFMLQFLILVPVHFKDEGQGILLGMWVIAVAKFTDVGALLFGKKFGKHKMAPDISPNKTWEGTIGGILLSLLVSLTYYMLFERFLPQAFTLWMALWMALPLAVVGIISDLIESMLKRQADVKDSGTVIPGIGGAFDLVDSLVLTAPFGYMLFSMTVFR